MEWITYIHTIIMVYKVVGEHLLSKYIHTAIQAQAHLHQWFGDSFSCHNLRSGVKMFIIF